MASAKTVKSSWTSPSVVVSARVTPTASGQSCRISRPRSSAAANTRARVAASSDIRSVSKKLSQVIGISSWANPSASTEVSAAIREANFRNPSGP